MYQIGIIITFFLVILLTGKRNKTTADAYLSWWLLVIGIHLSLFYLHFATGDIIVPYFLGVEIPLPLVHGPFLYIYTSALTGKTTKRAVNFLHFIPAAVAYLYLIPFFTSSSEDKIHIYRNAGIGYETILELNAVAYIVLGVTYVGLCFRILHKHKITTREKFSYTDKINLNWLRFLTYGILIIWSATIVGTSVITFSCVVLFVLLLGYFGIKQVGIFSEKINTTIEYNQETFSLVNSENFGIAGHYESAVGNQRLSEIDNSEPASIGAIDFEPPVTAKYLKSGLSEPEALKIHGQLCFRMQQEKLFTDPELSLSQLAEKLGIHPNILSQVINTYEKKTFYDFINELRIEEFKQVVGLPENEKYTLLSLAFECGYNSKTSFNRNFKKITGLSPSEYLKQAKINLV